MKLITFFRILFTKKRLMRNRKLQFEFNEIFRKPTKREVKKQIKDWKERGILM